MARLAAVLLTAVSASSGLHVLPSAATAPPPPVRLQCNATLVAGSTLALTDKLDLSGRQPDQPASITTPCAIVGPPAGGPPATVLVPANDCVLLAQGEVSITGSVRFIVGHKNRHFDCCDDGEGHGGILCSYTNLTIAEGAVVTVETSDATAVLNPGGFWTGGYITVDGTVNASLLPGQLTGVNGLLSASGVRIGVTGRVIVSGAKIARGAAIQAGDYGTVLDGEVTCSSYHSSDSGGCVAGAKYLAVGPTGRIDVVHATGDVAGVVASATDMSTYPFRGTVTAAHVHCEDSGAMLSASDLVMSGNASIVGADLYSAGGGAVVACDTLTMEDDASIAVNGSWGGDAGAIAAALTVLRGNARVACENAYADSAGGCIGGSLEMDGNASVVARNVTAKALGGAIAGGYPNQYLALRGGARVDVQGSTAGHLGGAVFYWQNISASGMFRVRIAQSAAPCGGAVVVGVGSKGGGDMFLDTTGGGVLHIEDAHELDAMLGCVSVQAALHPDQPQPCGAGCAAPSVAPTCTCDNTTQSSSFVECCNGHNNNNNNNRNKRSA